MRRLTPRNVNTTTNAVRGPAELTIHGLSPVSGAGCDAGVVKLPCPDIQHVRPSSPLPVPSHPSPPPVPHPMHPRFISILISPTPNGSPALGVAGVCPPNPVDSRHQTTPATLLRRSSVVFLHNGSFDCRGGIDVRAQPGAKTHSATPILPPSSSSTAVTVEAHAKPGSEEKSGAPTVSPFISTFAHTASMYQHKAAHAILCGAVLIVSMRMSARTPASPHTN